MSQYVAGLEHSTILFNPSRWPGLGLIKWGMRSCHLYTWACALFPRRFICAVGLITPVYNVIANS